MKLRVLFAVAVGGVVWWNASAERAVSTGEENFAVVKASDFGFDPEDSTDALTKALNSGAKRVVIDRQTGPWIARPLFLRRGDKEIVLEDGVELRAKKDEFKPLVDALLSISGARNVTIRGEGTAIIAMNKKDYQDASRYRPSEWRHAISIRDNAQNITVRDLTVLASGGDGVYLFRTDGVRLENLKVLDHHRQGISVISASNVLAKNCDFSKTWGTPPACGIDFEPNASDEEIVNNVFENCRFNDNQVSGIAFHIVQLTKASRPVSIIFRDCEIAGNREFGVSFARTMSDDYGVNGSILFERCRFSGNGESVLNLKNLSPQGFQFDFRDCTFDARTTKSPALRFNNGMALFDFGGVSMPGCRVLCNSGQTPLEFLGAVGAGVVGTKGELTIETAGEPERKLDLVRFAADHAPRPEIRSTFRPTMLNLRDLAPPEHATMKPVSRPPQYFRWALSFVQYVPAPGEYTVNLRVRHPRTGGDRIQVRLSDRIGTNLGQTELPAKDGPYTFKALGAGYYLIEVRPAGNFVDVTSDLPGHGFPAYARTSLFGCPGREYFFRVKEGARDINIEMSPDQGESAQFQLVSPEGRIVAETPKTDATSVLSFRRADAGPSEVWSVRMPHLLEDCRIRLGDGIVPILSDSREAVVSISKHNQEVN